MTRMIAIFVLLLPIGESLPFDTSCIVEKYGHVGVKDTRVKQVEVYVGQWNLAGNRIGSSKFLLDRGKVSVLQLHYDGYGGFQDQNPRNLTLFFDGEKLYGAIRLLLDFTDKQFNRTQIWGGCQGVEMEGGDYENVIYYEYIAETAYKNRTLRQEELAFELTSYDKPLKPSYDDSCAYIHKADLANNITITAGMSPVTVNVTHVYRKVTGSYTFHREYTLMWQDLVTVMPGKPTVIQVNQTVARSDYGWTGYMTNPRNLTLWLNETNHLNVAISYLRQKNNALYGSNVRYESWECAEVLRASDGDIQVTFAEYSEFNSIIYYGKYYKDVLLISGCHSWTFQLTIVVITLHLLTLLLL